MQGTRVSSVRKDLSSSVLMIGTTLTKSIKNNIETKNWQLNSLCDRGVSGRYSCKGGAGMLPRPPNPAHVSNEIYAFCYHLRTSMVVVAHRYNAVGFNMRGHNLCSQN